MLLPMFLIWSTLITITPADIDSIGMSMKTAAATQNRGKLIILLDPSPIFEDLSSLEISRSNIISNITKTFKEYISIKLPHAKNHQKIQECLWEAKSPQEADCMTTKEMNFIATKIQPQLQFFRRLAGEIKTILNSLKHIYHNLQIKLEDQTLFPETNPNTLNIFQGKQNSSLETTTNKAQITHQDQPHKTAEFIQQLNMAAQQISDSYSDISVTQDVNPDLQLTKHFAQNEYITNQWNTITLNNNNVKVYTAMNENVILIESTAIILSSNTREISLLKSQINNIGTDLVTEWDSMLANLTGMIPKFEMSPIQAIKGTIHSIQTDVTKKINTFEKIITPHQRWDNKISGSFLEQILAILTILKPFILKAMTRSSQTILSINNNTAALKKHPQLLGRNLVIQPEEVIISAEFIQSTQFLIMEINLNFQSSLFPTGHYMEWNYKGNSYLTPITALEFEKGHIKINEILTNPHTKYIQGTEQEACLAATKSAIIQDVIKACHYETTTPLVSNYKISPNYIEFNSQKHTIFKLSCRCNSNTTAIMIKLWGIGKLNIPPQCTPTPYQPLPNEPIPTLDSTNKEIQQCLQTNLSSLLKFEQSFLNTSIFLEFIKANKITPLQATELAINFLQYRMTVADDKDNLVLAIDILKSMRKGPQVDKWLEVEKWFAVPANTFSVSITIITVLVWVILIYNCNAYRIHANRIDAREEIDNYSAFVTKKLEEMEMKSFFPKSPDSDTDSN